MCLPETSHGQMTEPRPRNYQFPTKAAMDGPGGLRDSFWAGVPDDAPTNGCWLWQGEERLMFTSQGGSRLGVNVRRLGLMVTGTHIPRNMEVYQTCERGKRRVCVQPLCQMYKPSRKLLPGSALDERQKEDIGKALIGYMRDKRGTRE